MVGESLYTEDNSMNVRPRVFHRAQHRIGLLPVEVQTDTGATVHNYVLEVSTSTGKLYLREVVEEITTAFDEAHADPAPTAGDPLKENAENDGRSGRGGKAGTA